MKTKDALNGMKVADRTTGRRLRRMFDDYADDVLEDSGFVEEDATADKADTYTVVKNLPTKDDYLRMKEQTYTVTVEQAVDSACCTFEDLAGEMCDWFESMPENFQSSDKADTIQQTADTLGGINMPDIPDSLKGLTLVYLPGEVRSRADRNGEAIAMLEAVMNRLGEVAGASDFVDELQDVIFTAEDAEFPGMYG